MHNADDVVDGSLVHGNTRVGARPQHLRELFNSGIRGDRDDFRTRLHDLANSFVAELDYGLNQVAIAFFENAFFLARLNKGIHGFRGMLRLRLRMLASERGHRLAEADRKRYRENQIDKPTHDQGKVRKPFATGARKQNVRDDAIENDNEDDDLGCALKNLLSAPPFSAEDPVGDQKRNGCGSELLQHSHGESSAVAADTQARFDFVLERFNVLLKFARKELTRFGVDPFDIRDKSQQAEQNQQGDAEGGIHQRTDPFGRRGLAVSAPEEMVLRRLDTCASFERVLRWPFAVSERAIKPADKPSFRRKRLSTRPISPLSIS